MSMHTSSFGRVPYSFIHKLTFLSDAWHSIMHSMVLWSHLNEDEMFCFFCHKRFGIPIIKSSSRLSQVLRSWKFLKRTPQSLSAMLDNYNNSIGCLWHFFKGAFISVARFTCSRSKANNLYSAALFSCFSSFSHCTVSLSIKSSESVRITHWPDVSWNVFPQLFSDWSELSVAENLNETPKNQQSTRSSCKGWWNEFRNWNII